MPYNNDTLIGELLVREGIITPEQLDMALKEQVRSPGFLCRTLVEMHFAAEERVYESLSNKINTPYVRLKYRDISPAVIKKIPASFASHYKIVPLEFTDHSITIATSTPLDAHALDDMRFLLNLEIKAVLAGHVDVEEAIRKYYGVGAETLEKIMDKADTGPSVQQGAAEEISEVTEEASIVKFVNQILCEAIKDRATDIHLEPFKDELRTRFRIDGMLYDISIPETIKHFHQAIVSRIKIMARLNIAERRLPQDGRLQIKTTVQGEVDLRVSTLPTVFGEAIHLRVLSSGFFLQLENLGLSRDNMEKIEKAIRKPHGILFVTGPTGSGKSTTLYACMARINSSGIKIITIEDPVEYQMRGISQLQVNPQISFTFATALRHMLRHDPDVMMVGEVRDFDTAEIAIRSALTGHMVLSTLHTNDAAGAVTRLLDMGIEPFLVSSSLECLVAQRLVRVLCSACKVPVEASDEALKEIRKEIYVDSAQAVLFENKGCPECRFTGYRGRTGIHEVMTMTEAIRQMMLERASSQQIKSRAIKEGMLTLRQDGFRKVLEGQTTFTEIMRVTQQEESAKQ
jgi:type II secretory ATPase GspE/PulE/Tfp pilus assembly ATPase PilB-like protein